jgi:amidase
VPARSPDGDANHARRNFLGAAAGAVASLTVGSTQAAESQELPPFAHEEATFADLAARMERGELDSRALTGAYLERISRIDRAGPGLRSVIELNPEAEAVARALDAERKAGRVRGPLHGMPLLVKDNIATGDGMATSAGSLALEGYRAAEDAPLVKALREAGAVILGKSNLSEWANFRSSNSLSGWSSRGGQTRNPYALDRTPSGSSSGSAVAVAANLCGAAIGTETDGSITSPASCNNIVGLKPTLGLVSQAGIVPIAHSQDTAGPMARTVQDCALLMNALQTLGKRIDFTAHLGLAQLAGVRLGVGRQFFGINEKADRVIEDALAMLKDLGATLIDVEIATLGKFDEAELDILFYEFKSDLNQWLANALPRPPIGSLSDLIDYNARNAERTMPIFGQDLLVKAQQHGPLTEAKYRSALAKCRRLARTEGIDAVVKKHRVEAIVAATSSPPWLIDPVNGDLSRGGCTSLPAVAGYPHVTVPAGFAGGLPVGLSFFGPAMADARLLGIAHAFESASRHRKAPAFTLPSRTA